MQFYVFFIFCVYTFYLILENVSINVRNFRFPCYIGHLDVVYNWFICHQLFLIIYLNIKNNPTDCLADWKTPFAGYFMYAFYKIVHMFLCSIRFFKSYTKHHKTCCSLKMANFSNMFPNISQINYLSVFSSVVYLSIYMSIYLFFYLSIYLSIFHLLK